MRYVARDTVRILHHPQHCGEVRTVSHVKDGLLFFAGVDEGLRPDQVERFRYRAGDTVRILHPEHQGEVRAVSCKMDALLFFPGVDGGIWPYLVELVRERTGNPCGKPCNHLPKEGCVHCRGLCQQPYGECPPRAGEAPSIVFTGPR